MFIIRSHTLTSFIDRVPNRMFSKRYLINIIVSSRPTTVVVVKSFENAEEPSKSKTVREGTSILWNVLANWTERNMNRNANMGDS